MYLCPYPCCFCIYVLTPVVYAFLYLPLSKAHCRYLPAADLQSMMVPMGLHCTSLNCTPLNCTALHCTALHCTHCTVLHCTALHCTALHCTALHCTALHCTGPGIFLSALALDFLCPPGLTTWFVTFLLDRIIPNILPLCKVMFLGSLHPLPIVLLLLSVFQ